MLIGIIGSGTMGAGIAQTIALNGIQVIVRDISEAQLEKGKASIHGSLSRLLEKSKITREKMDEALELLSFSTEIAALIDCNIIIEAASENLAIFSCSTKGLSKQPILCPPNSFSSDSAVTSPLSSNLS